MATDKQKLTADLDRLWRNYVKDRDRARCRRCDRTYGVGAAHLFARTRIGTRWNPSNGFALCIYCHCWAHDRAQSFHEWAISELGTTCYARLKAKAQLKPSVTVEQLLKIKTLLERLING